MTLRSKINWLVSINIFFVLILLISSVSYMIIESAFRETGERALMVTKTVASLPQIVQAFEKQNPAQTIQPIAEGIRKGTGAEFIVVSNMNLLRYSHPNPDNIGKHMVGEDNDAVLKGQESITRAKGTLGYSLRGKAPVFDSNNHQIGVVSTGFLVRNIWGSLYSMLLKLMGIGIIALLFGLFGAYLLSRHIKKQIFNMEPHEIAFATQEQAAILEAIREGIIAVNSSGSIVSCNREAKKMLGMEDIDLIGKELSAVFPSTRLPEVLKDGIPQYDQSMIVGNTLVITNRVPVILAGKVIGAVATFRDKMQLDHMDQRLADIGRYVDTLRSQRHEFMNKLHLISGLIQMSEYDTAKEVIEEVNEEHHNAIQFYLARIRDSAIVGILVGKTHLAGELGIQLTVLPESYISERCPHREIMVTILGNTIENAFEAIRLSDVKITYPAVTVFMKEEADHLIIRIRDNGPGVDPAVRDHLFEDGTTTKGKGRGFGLWLISRLIFNVGGSVTCDSSTKGTLMSISLPMERSV
jgi:sensor histidine kinase regulating citrate/malate metabolism